MTSTQENSTGPGIFITFEGGDGAGKTTHITFLASCLRKMGYEVLCLREPGGTVIGESLRQIVLDPANSDMSDQTELLIYEAARAQIVKEVIIPALARGAVVLLDRFDDCVSGIWTRVTLVLCSASEYFCLPGSASLPYYFAHYRIFCGGGA